MPETLTASFTVFASAQPLTKRFDLDLDGRIRKSKGVPFASGRAGRFDLKGATPLEVLTTFGSLLGELSAHHAIGLGIERSGLATVDVVTAATAADGEISRTLAHWHYPPGPGLFEVDLDSGRGFNGLAASVYPPWAALATLTRPSVSDGISNPRSGETLEGSGEHVFALIDALPHAKAAAEALDRLFWQAGLGRVFVAKNGALHPRSPIDLKIYSAERVLYEGAARISAPLVAAPRASDVRDGCVLSASDLIAFADARISAAETYEMFVEACRDPAVREDAKAKNAAWNAERIAQGKQPIHSGRGQAARSRPPREHPAEATAACAVGPRACRPPLTGVTRDAAWRAARWRELHARTA